MKLFQMIHLNSNQPARKQRLMDTLLKNGITCFGIGPHLIVIDEKPEGSRHAFQDRELLKNDIQARMKKAGAELLQFDSRAFRSFKRALSKEYVFKHATKTSMTYHSKTQPASFTVYQNGRLKTSKDLLDVALMVNLVRICYGEKPKNPANSL